VAVIAAIVGCATASALRRLTEDGPENAAMISTPDEPRHATAVAPIAIVGAGFAGLLAARLLEAAGVRGAVLFEAQPTLGGRILSEPAGAADRVDLGPTWFWPDHQPDLSRLIDELGLPRFAQFDTGDLLLERRPGAPPERVRSPWETPVSMRLQGGMAGLTEALHAGLRHTHVLGAHRVLHLAVRDAGVELTVQGPAGEPDRWQAGHVLLALPPRLAAGLGCTPPLPPALQQAWQHTPTWMAPHAKYVAVYDTPFWRAQGLSGQARSAMGPLGEIHDASPPQGGGALFGFFGLLASARLRAGEGALRQLARAQLQRLFGPAAGTPQAEFFKDWAASPHTATAADLQAAPAHHAPAPAAAAASGAWAGRITGIGSEWSPQYPGYLAGAVEAAQDGVAAWLAGRQP
jgi:monoamine oxidase